MRKSLLIVTLSFSGRIVFCQNYIACPIGVFGAQYNAATTIANGGSVFVGNGGSWGFGGNVISADKGNNASPSTTGESESILFSGTGTYSGANTTVGNSSATSYIVDGYAGASGQAGNFVIPLGLVTTAYPVTVPAGQASTVAYFDGPGTSSSQFLLGTTVTIFGPFVDFSNTSSATGSFTISWSGQVGPSLGKDYFVSSTTSVGANSGNTFAELAFLGSLFNGAAGSATQSFTVPVGVSRIAFATSPVVLPIQLLGLTATPLNNTAILLRWETAGESNDKGFFVERSTDNGGSWKELGFVGSLAAGGNSANSLAYSYTDQAPALGSNEYRLEQIDLDGNMSLSYTVSANITTGPLKLYPCPATDMVLVQGAQMGAMFKVLDVSGKMVVSQTMNPEINVAILPRGIYYVEVIYMGKVQAIAFFKN